jgi:hypothetical protein
MKPQIVVQDIYGKNNVDLETSVARIIKGASWKKQRVIMIIPAGDMIPAKVYLSHCCLIFPPNQHHHRMLALGQEVGDAYNNCIESILAHSDLSGWEYILTIEHDNAPPADGLLKLIARMDKHPEFSCIGGLYWTKGEGGVPQLWGSPEQDPIMNFRPQIPRPGELMEVYGTGMGFNLWRLEMFKDTRIKKPWFKTKASKEEGVGTQDLAFWVEARKYGYRCAVDCDVLVGHFDHQTDIMW